jgi:hypothetical protein
MCRWGMYLRAYLREPSANGVEMPGTGLEPVRGRPRGIFLLTTAFAAARRGFAGSHLESGLYLCPVARTRVSRGRQVSTLSSPPRGARSAATSARLSSVLQPPVRAAVPPTLTPFTPAVSERGAQCLSPLRLPISPPRQRGAHSTAWAKAARAGARTPAIEAGTASATSRRLEAGKRKSPPSHTREQSCCFRRRQLGPNEAPQADIRRKSID